MTAAPGGRTLPLMRTTMIGLLATALAAAALALIGPADASARPLMVARSDGVRVALMRPHCHAGETVYRVRYRNRSDEERSVRVGAYAFRLSPDELEVHRFRIRRGTHVDASFYVSDRLLMAKALEPKRRCHARG